MSSKSFPSVNIICQRARQTYNLYGSSSQLVSPASVRTWSDIEASQCSKVTSTICLLFPLGHTCRYSRAAINSSAFTSSVQFLKPLSPLEFPLEWFWICLHSKLLKLLESKDSPVTINKERTKSWVSFSSRVKWSSSRKMINKGAGKGAGIFLSVRSWQHFCTTTNNFWFVLYNLSRGRKQGEGRRYPQN